MYVHTHTHTHTHTYPTNFIVVSVGVYWTILLYWDGIYQEMDASVLNYIKENW